MRVRLAGGDTRFGIRIGNPVATQGATVGTRATCMPTIGLRRAYPADSHRIAMLILGGRTPYILGNR